MLEAENNQEDESAGNRSSFFKELYIEKEDFLKIQITNFQIDSWKGSSFKKRLHHKVKA